MVVEIEHDERAQQAYAFDDVSIVPSRRTRGDEEVSLAWRIDAGSLRLPAAGRPRWTR